MQRSDGAAAPAPAARIGAGPISWGVCEVPGWGTMLPAERVLGEMAALGIRGTELGAPGFLPDDAGELRRLLDRHGISLIGGFVPLVMHDPAHRPAALAGARAVAELFAAAGGDVFVSAAVVDAAWSPRVPLTPPQWDHVAATLAELDEICAVAGLVHVLHPHVGTLVETRDDVRTVMQRSPVSWCLDTGHLLVGGYDPLAFAADAAGRIGHVHLKDVRGDVAARVRDGELTLLAGVRAGLFCPLGRGDAPIAATVERLEADGYRGWYVLEQDTDLGAAVPLPGEGPVTDARDSVDHLQAVLARAR